MLRWRIAIVMGTLSGIVAGALGYASGQVPSSGEIVSLSGAETDPREFKPGDEITIVSWNIHYGGGPTLEVGRGQSRSEVVGHLDAVAASIRQWDADIVALQEVDREALRSFDIDQLQWLAEATGLRHAAWTPTWNVRWVPHPGFDPRTQIGRVYSGQAILSRFPIKEAHHVRLPQPRETGALYNLFYLHRHITDTTIQLGAQHQVRVVNAHLEAFESANRMAHADQTAQQLGGSNVHTVLLGDMNCTPPEAKVRRNFPDEPETDMSRDDTIHRLRSIPGLSEVVPERVYRADENAWFTFPAQAPNRRLDYIFHGSGLTLVRAEVPQMKDPPSDHLPVVARFRID